MKKNILLLMLIATTTILGMEEDDAADQIEKTYTICRPIPGSSQYMELELTLRNDQKINDPEIQAKIDDTYQKHLRNYVTQNKSIAKANKGFLDSIKKRENYLAHYQKLATGLVIQARYMEKIKTIMGDSEEIKTANHLLDLTVFPRGTTLSQSVDKSEYLNCFLIKYTPETREGLQAFLKYRKYLRMSEFNQETVYGLIAKLLSYPKSSEPHRFGEYLQAQYRVWWATKEHYEKRQKLELFAKKIIDEHTHAFLQLHPNYNGDSVREKFNHLIRSLADGKAEYEDDYVGYQADLEELYDLYNKVVGRLQQDVQALSKNKKGGFEHYLKTIEQYPQLLPPSLNDPFYVPKPVQTSKKKSATQAVKKAPKKLPEPKIYNEIPQSITPALDGSYTDPLHTDEDEVVIVHPETGVRCVLFALEQGNNAVTIKLEHLQSTRNIRLWKNNPEQALKSLGYKTFGNRNYNNPDDLQRMKQIHSLPEEIKRYASTHAQQTTIPSRKYPGQTDHRITFCGELQYPNGTKELGLFIYLVDHKTDEIFHQLFTIESYKNLFDSFKENGDFRKVFFPLPDWPKE